jgi:glycosyltransferase involved in cell wall biosynthesis
MERTGDDLRADILDPVRVAIDAGPLYGHRTGVGVAASGIIESLTTRPDVVVDPFLVSFRAAPHAGHRRLPVPGIVASHVWSRSSRPGADRWFAATDLVHGTNYVVPPTRLPAVVSVYDCWFLRHPELASAVVRRAGHRLHRAAGSGAWIHTCSADTEAQVRDLLGTDRVVTVPLGRPPALPEADARQAAPVESWVGGNPFVFAIGTEEQRKDLGMLIDAFGLLAGEMPDVRLVLAGAGGDATPAVDQALARLPASTVARVRRLGPIDDGLKHWLLRRSTVLAYPSLDEGFGFPLLEAQAASTPVVASDVGAIGEVAGAGVVLVTGRDPQRFAEQLRRTITDGALRLGLIDAGHRNLGRFTWEQTADGLVRLYRTAVETGR